MNTRSHNVELTVTPGQVGEVAKAVFHTILFHRTTGKYTYNTHQPGTFSVGCVGSEDVDCSTVPFTYVKCEADDLDGWLSQQIGGFCNSLCQQGPTKSGKLTLEFFERKKGRWLLSSETINWEVWHLQLKVTEPSSDEAWQRHQEALTTALSDAVLYISQVVNQPEYIPRNPTADDLPNVFDTKFSAVQPYLHRLTCEVGGEGVAGTVRKFIRDTFAY